MELNSKKKVFPGIEPEKGLFAYPSKASGSLPTGLGKFCLTFWAGDADTSLALRDSNLLSTGWTTIDMVGLSLLHVGFAATKLQCNLILEIDEFQILLVPLLVVSREHSKDSIDGRSKSKPTKKSASDKEIHYI